MSQELELLEAELAMKKEKRKAGPKERQLLVKLHSLSLMDSCTWSGGVTGTYFEMEVGYCSGEINLLVHSQCFCLQSDASPVYS